MQGLVVSYAKKGYYNSDLNFFLKKNIFFKVTSHGLSFLNGGFV